MFSAQGHSSVSSVSPSITQPTILSTSTMPTSSRVTPGPMSTQSAGASPLPSPNDAGRSMGLSKGALAGLAAAATALVVILMVGASKMLLKLKERRQRRAIDERKESPMLFWDKTPSVSRLKIATAEPQELDGSQLGAPAGRQGETLSSKCPSHNQDRLMSGCWPDRPWVPRHTQLPLS